MSHAYSDQDPMGHLAALVRYSDDAIVSKSLEGIVTSWNYAAEKMFGYGADEAIGQSIRLIVPRDLWPEEEDVLSRVRRGEVIDHYETVRRRKDGVLLNISLTVSPIKDKSGRIVGASKIARDITARREAEAQQRKMEAERIHLLEMAKTASRAKDEFLAILSHELRTPLNAILGWSELLRLRNADATLLDRGLATISRNVKSQAKLIDDLLDVSKIVSGKMRLDVQATDLTAVVAEALEAVRPAAEAKSIRLTPILDPSGTVLGDAQRLQQVTWNLLSNAVKFTPKGGRIQVAVLRINSHVEVVVSDTGKGIAAEFLPHVFDRFSQADMSLQRQYGGLGLGLTIAHELVELHGGTIEARSEGEGQGATFVVKLPRSLVHPAPAAEARAHPTVEAPAPAPLPSPELGGLRVLVVDDDASTREIAEAILTSLGARVLQASSAAEALSTLKAERPDVLIADIGMPGEDGYSLIRKVRALSASAGGVTPAAALTAFARSEDRWRALEAGFHLHLAKPVEPLDLAMAVAHLAGRGTPATPPASPDPPAADPAAPAPA